MQNDPVVIVSIARTAQGNMLGCFKDLSGPELGAAAIKAALERAQLKPDAIEEVVMGCVLPAGQGQAPARQAAIKAGLPVSVGSTTINKMCGSGMKAVMFGHDLICANSAEVVVAGGMESMTNAPYLVPKGRSGYRLGHGTLVDHMLMDGLEDAYDKGKLMGVFAEQTAKKFGFTREKQDKFAIASLERAQKANAKGAFTTEITPVTVKTRKGEMIVDHDENPCVAKVEKIPSLRPAFAKEGTVTAANSSSISDGAAALVLMRQSKANALGLKPLAIIHGHATYSQEPAWFTTAPAALIQKLLKKTGWSVANVDLFEVNEAFAVVPMATMQELGIPHEKLNIHGGACALGHPIGASGARILVTLVAALQRYSKRRGIASICIGGGEATAIAIETVQ